MTMSPCGARWPRNSSVSKKVFDAVSCSRGSRRSSCIDPDRREGAGLLIARGSNSHGSRKITSAVSVRKSHRVRARRLQQRDADRDECRYAGHAKRRGRAAEEHGRDINRAHSDRRDAAGRGRRIEAGGCSGRARAGGGDVVERGARWGGEEARRHDRLPRRASAAMRRRRSMSSSIRLHSGSTTFFTGLAIRSAPSRRSGSMRSISFSR